MVAAVWVFSLLAVYSPFSPGVWKSHPHVVVYVSEAFSYIPFAVLLGLILWRLFPSARVLNALLSVAIATLIGVAPAVADLRAALDNLVALPEFSITYLVGVPAVVYALERRRLTIGSSGP